MYFYDLGEGKIEISSIQATAYWWVNKLIYRTRDIAMRLNSLHLSKDEIKFYNIFKSYTDKEWRNLYLNLTDYITEDVNNYKPQGYYDLDYFCQDTDKGKHDRLNAELAKITNTKGFPDIRIADNFSKDEVVYTNMFGASVWYKSCGVTPLETEVYPRYILTGNEEELEFYNQFLATLIILDEKAHKFDSPDWFATEFCRAYKKENGVENIEKVSMMFDKSFSIANERRLIIGGRWSDDYMCNILDMDKLGLEKYMDKAKHYASKVLEGTEFEGLIEEENELK